MTGNLAVRHALSNQAGDPALLLAQKFGPLSIGQKQRARAAKSLNDLFDRMSTQELEEYATNGTLPSWFDAVSGAGSELR